MGECVALVVAAGRGERFGGEVPKQYVGLGGEALLRRALGVFLDHPAVDAVRPVIHPGDRALFDASTAGMALMEPVAGGATRQESVRLGLESLAKAAPYAVLIHDAARPFVDAGLISRVLSALDEVPAAVPAIPVSDTLKRSALDAAPLRLAGTVDRAGLWRAQTPQAFRFADILAAHGRLADKDLTDDAAVAEEAGLAVALVAGSEDNFKVTTADDLGRARRHLGGAEIRTGMGYDVHRFGPGDHVMLCGVAVPHSAGLIGHSDADVGLHALTDALLGAIGDGDIGSHFPPTDPRWRDVPSATFLRHAGDLVIARRGAILNLDVTVICERPRLAPHRTAMIERIAEILGLAAERVSVKATTTEGLGFTGRGEGIAAQGIATIAFQ
ncbi:MAG: bifunctional 2-C-methyl-D-erythritol 4-phosphate cytidylyltransferase/2-C-methyl-D-erythritol 2,4-cyclodiphosphate synthase [Rhodospirillales bacterium]|jgi:2-C-methyl-D-erythritol 4-phosphate cytidylyltransferase/2-C-methyl-D-erythritol 2,4-cyclodiphosphate synthase|nr:bifunctional 2-C-methyl-D-erythritol 4-phosphate cytidylyltransferase/2-C-methyl-D-erythritol 2,4-cyclodiphosphate synthase [Rhodospirillales bacterium]